MHPTPARRSRPATSGIVVGARVGHGDGWCWDHLRMDGDRIIEPTVMIRPRSGLAALVAETGDRLGA